MNPVSVSLLVLMVTLNRRSLDFVDLQLLNPHLRPELPESESAEPERSATSCGCWLACEDECGGIRSLDLDLSALLERPLCSADGGGPAEGDEGFTAVKSFDASSGS